MKVAFSWIKRKVLVPVFLYLIDAARLGVLTACERFRLYDFSTCQPKLGRR